MPNKLGSEFQINTYTTNDQANPSLAALSNGNFVAAWQSNGQDGSSYGVYGQMFTASGGVVGSEFQINTYTTNDQANPSLAALNNGSFVAAWQSDGQDGSYGGVYGQVFMASGSRVGSEFRINNYTTWLQGAPSLVGLSNGNFVAAWEGDGEDGSGYGVYGQVFTASGSMVGSEFQINTNTINNQWGPRLAALSNGNFVAAWQSYLQDGSSTGVYGQVFPAGWNGSGSRVGSEFRINTNTTDYQDSARLAALSNGNFVAAWESQGQDGSGTGVYGQVFPVGWNGSGSRVGNEFRINTNTTNNQQNPSLAALSNGNFVVAWQSQEQDGSGYGVYGQVFTASGSVMGGEFRINTNTTNDQMNPSLAALSNGNFVAAWESQGQDGSGYGVYGQIFYGQIVANSVNQSLSYTEDTPLALSNLFILGALNDNAITTTLTLLPAGAGALNTATSGNVTSMYTAGSGIWQALGDIQNMNNLLAGLVFTPTANSYQNATIGVNMSDGASTPVAGIWNLAGIPVNDMPVLVNNQLTVTQGQAVVLSAANLSATDVDTLESNLLFTVNNVRGGDFELINNPGASVTSFTQQQINNGQVRFVPNGSEVKPAYDISVSDGLLSTSPTAANVTFVLLNKPPVVMNDLVDQVVTVGQPFNFTVPNTTFSDPEGAPLTYSAKQVDGSALPSWLHFDAVKRFFNGTALQAGENTYSVWATDPGNLATHADFNLTALAAGSTNQQSDTSAVGAMAGGVVGGLAALAAIGGAAYAFWKRPWEKKSSDEDIVMKPPLSEGQRRRSMAPVLAVESAAQS